MSPVLQAIDNLRKRTYSKRRREVLDLAVSYIKELEAKASMVQDPERVTRALKREATANRRAARRMKKQLNASNAEIAKALGISEADVAAMDL